MDWTHLGPEARRSSSPSAGGRGVVKSHGGQPVEMLGAPLKKAAGAVVMMHGRNAGPRNILDLVPKLHHPAFAYVAPAAAGHTWYHYSFMAETDSNQPGLSSGLFAMGEVIGAVVKAGVSQDRIILLGFSQGACLASEFAVRNARRWGGVIAFSGGLIYRPGGNCVADGRVVRRNAGLLRMQRRGCARAESAGRRERRGVLGHGRRGHQADLSWHGPFGKR